MSEDQTIISKGTYENARGASIIQTFLMLVDELKEHPEMTVNASMYVDDVGFLLKQQIKMIDDLTKIQETLKPI